MKLNLGCGKDIRVGYINIDRKPWPGVNIVMDIQEPLPFPDGSVDEIRAWSVLEHLIEWEAVVEECLRVLRPGGVLDAHVPYRLNCNTFHKRYFDETSFNGFVVGSPEFVGPEATTLEGIQAFHIEKITIERKPRYPFAWHLKKYLGLPYVGRKWAIGFILRKIIP